MWQHLAYWQASPAVVLAASRPVMWLSLLMGALSQNGVSLRIWFQPRNPPENNELQREDMNYWAGWRLIIALMLILDLFCKNSCFMLLESAPRVPLPSCAASVSGALRHGAP